MKFITIGMFCGIFFICNLGADVGKHQRFTIDNHMVKDTKKHLSWQDTRTVRFRKKTWVKAKQYCDNLKLDQLHDWRLPTLEELLSIVDYSKYEPAIVPIFKHAGKKGYYWTSNEVVTDNHYAWYVSFDYGNTYTYSKEESVYVRCVRDDK